jgi:hypothetical protein
MKVINGHNHLYPKEYLDYLEKSTGSLTMVRLNSITMVLYYEDTRLCTIKQARAS